MRIEQLAAGQLGLLSSRQAACGVARATLTDWVRTGRIVRPQRAIYQFASANPDHRDVEVVAALLRTGPGAVASHCTALHRHGLLDEDPRPVQITSARNVVAEGAVIYRRALPHRDIVRRGTVWVTRLERAIAKASELLSLPRLHRVVADAVRTRRTTLDRIEQELAQTPGARRAGNANLRTVLAEPLTESEAERELLHLLRCLPYEFTVQHAVPESGRGWRIDIARACAKLAVELDSYLWHSSPADQQREIDKHNDLIRLGWIVRRFTPGDVRERPDYVLALVRAVLEP